MKEQKIGHQKILSLQMIFLKIAQLLLYLIVINVEMNLKVRFIIYQMALGAQSVDIKQKRN